MKKMTCDECSHFFDPSDKRASISSGAAKYPTYCPLCAYQHYKGVEQWAVWNDCQGIFECRASLDEVKKLIASDYPDVGARPMPVRIYPEPEDRHHFREWLEHQRAA